ncbi:hypothetical protein C364_01866 [Cryptococcus neoformans Bt63]|nr:hypothetical protein C364_01866 [Cryptococcus neoformans var. grubii Bt63]
MATLAAHHVLSASLDGSAPSLVQTDSTDSPLDSPLSEGIVTPLHSGCSSPVIRSSIYPCHCSRGPGHDDFARFFDECDPFLVADNDEDREEKVAGTKQTPSSPPPASFQCIVTDVQKIVCSSTPPNTLVSSPGPFLHAIITSTNTTRSDQSSSASQPSQRLMDTLSSHPLPFCAKKSSHRPHLHISVDNREEFSRISVTTTPITLNRPALPFGVSAYYLAKPELAKRRRFGDSKQDVALSAVLLNREFKTYTAPVKFKIDAQLDGSLLERDLKDVPSKRRDVSLSAYEYKQGVQDRETPDESTTMSRNKVFVGKKRVQFAAGGVCETVNSQLNASPVASSQLSDLLTSSSQCILNGCNDNSQYALERQTAHQPQLQGAEGESEDDMSIVSDMSVTVFLSVLHQIEVDMVKQFGQRLIPSWLVGWMRWVKHASESQSQPPTQSQPQSRSCDEVNLEDDEETFAMECLSSFEGRCLSPGLELQVA